MTQEQFDALKGMIESYADYRALEYGGQQKALAYKNYEESAQFAEELLVVNSLQHVCEGETGRPCSICGRLQ